MFQTSTTRTAKDWHASQRNSILSHTRAKKKMLTWRWKNTKAFVFFRGRQLIVILGFLNIYVRKHEGPVASDLTISRARRNVNRQSVVSERMSNPSSQVRCALRDATFTMTFAKWPNLQTRNQAGFSGIGFGQSCVQPGDLRNPRQLSWCEMNRDFGAVQKRNRNIPDVKTPLYVWNNMWRKCLCREEYIHYKICIRCYDVLLTHYY